MPMWLEMIHMINYWRCKLCRNIYARPYHHLHTSPFELSLVQKIHITSVTEDFLHRFRNRCWWRWCKKFM